MKQLPRELTPELLKLILGEKILGESREIGNNIQLCGDILHYEIVGSHMAKINVDTLTRLCKEWCVEQGYMLTIYHHLDTVAASASNGTAARYSTPSMSIYTELEAVIKMTYWITKRTKEIK